MSREKGITAMSNVTSGRRADGTPAAASDSVTGDRDTREVSLRENESKCNSSLLYLVGKPRIRPTVLVRSVQEDILYRWRKGIPSRRIARQFGIPREAVEAILHELLFGGKHDPPTPGQIRRAA